MILYRPVGMHELRLIFESGMTAFPPRLPEQPIFYPVLNIDYARQIAFGWNTKDAPYAGYVTEFEVDDDYIRQFERQVVGNRLHEELWIPAEELDTFNQHILRKIKVVDARFGKKFTGWSGEVTCLKDQDAVTQFVMISNGYDYNPVDPWFGIKREITAIFLNYPFWQQHDFSEHGIDEKKHQKILEFIQNAWESVVPELQLGIPA